ncbi:MAG: response regulator, partial [Candidatus Obscuribacterales bacterium]|nr:response regulator [Candidatus Obscuribacterales bacterium]
MAKLLLVEDDTDLSGRVNEWLCFEQHAVECVFDGMEATERLKFYQYELVILDWDLPKKTGIDVCKEFRARGGLTPILMLTGKGNINDKEIGLDAGADDYLTKPFHLKELSARIRALL